LLPAQSAARSLRGQDIGTPAVSPKSEAVTLRSEVGGAEGVNEELKRLIKELGDAINGSLSESEEIAEAIAKIKTEGYDVLLVLEATVGFSKREEEREERAAMVTAAREPEFRVNAQDVKFLKSLRISVDEAA
jgi:hypothetical protein